MRKHLLTLCAPLMALTFPCLAQITIDRNSLMHVGDSYTEYRTLTVTTVSAGQSGANRTWTIPACSWGATHVGQIIDPVGSLYADRFPEASLCDFRFLQGSGLDSVFVYYQTTDSALYEIGLVAGSNPIEDYDDPGVALPLPCTAQSAWTYVTRATFGGFTEIDSSLHTVDGWGTLQTPYGTYSCLRVFTRVYLITRSSFGDMTTEYVAYYWFLQNGMWAALLMSPLDNVDPAFSEGDVFMRDVSLPIGATGNPTVNRFSLAQNYPNPFNARTEIEYNLPRTQRVSLKVFDLLGREVTTLFSGRQAAGEHRVRFDGGDLPSGTYLYRLETDGDSQTRKMLLLK